MPNILLLGAGFSKNWGGPTATEFFTLLIADKEVQANQQIHDLLWNTRKNFEDALNALQHDGSRRPEWLILQGAVKRVFDRMNTIFARQQLELGRWALTEERSRKVVEFLARFDAIFTLNQDLLLEIHYFDQNHGLTASTRSWPGGVCVPGMQPMGPADGKPFSGRIWVPGETVHTERSQQLYVKLHGSANWKATPEGDALMILGGDKVGAIDGVATLKQYQELFSNYLMQTATRLTVIGYGFRDTHINDTLKAAVNQGLQIYVVDARGANIAYDERGDHGAQIKGPKTEFEEWFKKGLHSASTIPFRYLLADESVDYEVLLDFLKGK